MTSAQRPAQQEDGEADTSDATLLDLPPSICDSILSLLSPKDLCTANQVCKALAASGMQDLVWRAVALNRWPADSMTLHGSYATYKELTMDDNTRNTAWYYPLEPRTSSNYKHAHDNHFYQCRLIGMERPRDGSKELRLYYDARGEIDLRKAHTSKLMLELHVGVFGLPLPFAPIEVVEYASAPGHSKGCFTWGAALVKEIESAVGANVVRSKLVLFYACQPVVADYTGSTILSMLQGQDYEQVFRAGAVLTAKGAMGRQLAAEGEEEQRRRWADLPQGVKARGSGWPGANGFGAWPKPPN